MVYFVESSSKAAELVHKNLQSLKVTSGFEVLKQDVASALFTLNRQRRAADFIFLDPPYRMEAAYKDTLAALAEHSLLKAEGMVIAEHDKRFDPGEESGKLKRFRKLEQGDSSLSFYRNS